MEAHFHGSGKTDEAMDEFRMEQRGKLMTERAAMRAGEGIRSRPAAHLGFREARVPSTHSGVVGESERVGGGESKVGQEARLGEKVEELTEVKWLLRMLAMEVESELNEDQMPDDEGKEDLVASLKVFQMVEGCEFLLNSLWK
jgi:hypothetical protein